MIVFVEIILKPLLCNALNGNISKKTEQAHRTKSDQCVIFIFLSMTWNILIIPSTQYLDSITTIVLQSDVFSLKQCLM